MPRFDQNDESITFASENARDYLCQSSLSNGVDARASLVRSFVLGSARGRRRATQRHIEGAPYSPTCPTQIQLAG